MRLQTPPKTYTTAEYLELEETADSRHEYRDGEIVPMAGGSLNHNRMIRKLSGRLDIACSGQPYEVFTSDLRLWIPDCNLLLILM